MIKMFSVQRIKIQPFVQKNRQVAGKVMDGGDGTCPAENACRLISKGKRSRRPHDVNLLETFYTSAGVVIIHTLTPFAVNRQLRVERHEVKKTVILCVDKHKIILKENIRANKIQVEKCFGKRRGCRIQHGIVYPAEIAHCQSHFLLGKQPAGKKHHNH